MNLKSILNRYYEQLINKYSKSEIDFIFYTLAENILNQKSTILKLGINDDNPKILKKQAVFEIYLLQLLEDKPYQYIIGESYFYGLKFFVNEHTLIPRPETEELVEWILNDYKTIESKPIKILEIGTGTGCISISLAKNDSNFQLSALDYSENVLEIAKRNALYHNQEINFFKLDFLEIKNWEILGKFDVIISNPPYIKESEKKDIEANVLNYEPHSALFVSDENPLIFYEKILQFSKNHLIENGTIYVEINQNLGIETADLFKTNFENVVLKKDISGNNRMIKVY